MFIACLVNLVISMLFSIKVLQTLNIHLLSFPINISDYNVTNCVRCRLLTDRLQSGKKINLSVLAHTHVQGWTLKTLKQFSFVMIVFYIIYCALCGTDCFLIRNYLFKNFYFCTIPRVSLNKTVLVLKTGLQWKRI